ncbi:S9 family peptidase [Muriicola sp. Z0-33]|uniref:S9 family peptidase n=1 Tax=Muriicola sp. Z0-33 TaxID=2816957 RepID=UPI002238E505|nr:prolyl oligopeptidase family serine peptidase [Muriicola sp. Z0-33]MCW5518098.1 S9 family peptidase [Muriicola sp. Z0-33]
MNKNKPVLIFFLALLLLSCNDQKSTEGEETATDENAKLVSFKGREIDLSPFVEGFPYTSFQPVYAAGKLYYMKRGETMDLLELDLYNDGDLEKGKKISDIDYSTRNVWGIRYNENDKHLYWVGDESNDEIINLTRLNPETKEVEKLTDVPYIFGYRWNDAKDKVAYVARLGDKEERLGELRILDLKTKEESSIVQDTPEMRFTWGSPSWQPEGKGVVVNTLKNADRTFGNLIYIDFETKSKTLLTNSKKERSNLSAYPEWLNENTLLYTSNEDGFSNVYIHDLKKKESKQLTSFTSDLGSSEILTIDDNKYLFATTSSPIETQVYLVSLPDGEVVLQQNSDVVLNVYDSDGDKMLVSATSNTSMFRIDELKVSKEQIEFNTKVDVPQELKDKIYNTAVERITYPTFDIDPITGEPRQIHAYLYKPKNPLPEKERIVMIQSFYGGGNSFSTRYQILANAGIYVLSPSPRGSSGFGKEFSALNDKDLGGNEIIDVFYAAKFVSEKLNIPPSNIGVFGGSWGGYATMRTLTFPGDVNGNTVEFDWGFGISHAGFSDIIHFYENGNIPDWVILEAGDPKTEAAKLNDRSPLYHADKMKGHLLLTHGTNDSRVPIAGSEMIADSLEKYNKNVKLVKFEGQGHGIKGLDNKMIFYRTWFDFLEEVTKEND